MKEHQVVRVIYACAHILSYCYLLSNVGEATELPRCADASNIPERVTVAYFQVMDSALPIPNSDFELVKALSLELFNREQSLRNDTIVSVEYAVKQFYNRTESQVLETSKIAMELSLETLDNKTLREDMNLVAVAGGTVGHMSEAISMVSQVYGYPHLDMTDILSMSDTARFPMFVRVGPSDYITSKTYVALLKRLEICKIVLLSSFQYRDTADQFSKEASDNGIDVVKHMPSIGATNLHVQVEESIDTILETQAHFVVIFIDVYLFPQLLAHVHLSQRLKDLEFEIVWIGIPIFQLFTMYPLTNRYATDYYRQITTVFAENNITFDEVLNELQGSFDVHGMIPSGPVAEHFAAGVKSASVMPPAFMMLGADTLLAAAQGVRAMNANGYGCYLHSENFNELVAKKLYETIIAQKFWGNSGWVEFDENGDRKLQMHAVNYHLGHSVDNMNPFYDSPIPHDPVVVPSIIATYDCSELTFDPNKTIIWPGGTSPENPGTKPGDGMTSCQIPASVQFEYVAKKGVYVNPLIIAVCCVIGVVFLVLACLLYRRKRKLEKSMKNIQHTGRRVFDLEAPLEKVTKMIEELLEGKVPKKVELETLKEMLASGNIMTPKLKEQLLDADQESYSPDSIQFVLNYLPEISRFSTLRSAQKAATSDTGAASSCENSWSAVISDLHGTQSRVIGPEAQAWDFFGRAIKLPTPSEEDELKSKLPCLDAPGLYQFALMRPLEHVAMNVLDITFNLVVTLNLNRQKLMKFLRVIEDGYHASNPYHNRAHAADVTARFAAIVSHSKLDRVLVPEELLGGIIAAIIHDYQHPGSSNNFQIQSNTEVSMLYNESHILENASLFTALELLEHPEYRFTENIHETSMKAIKSIIIKCVVATDISEHFNIVSDFKSKVPPGSCEGNVESEQKSLILKMALKCADLGHTTVDLPEHLLWVNSLQAEFYLQGDCERELGLPISMLMDRSKHRNGPAHGEQQLGFFDFICIPMYKAWVERFPACSTLTKNLSENRMYWDMNAKEAAQTCVSTSEIEEVKPVLLK